MKKRAAKMPDQFNLCGEERQCSVEGGLWSVETGLCRSRPQPHRFVAELNGKAVPESDAISCGNLLHLTIATTALDALLSDTTSSPPRDACHERTTDRCRRMFPQISQHMLFNLYLSAQNAISEPGIRPTSWLFTRPLYQSQGWLGASWAKCLWQQSQQKMLNAPMQPAQKRFRKKKSIHIVMSGRGVAVELHCIAWQRVALHA